MLRFAPLSGVSQSLFDHVGLHYFQFFLPDLVCVLFNSISYELLLVKWDICESLEDLFSWRISDFLIRNAILLTSPDSERKRNGVGAVEPEGLSYG